MFSQRGRPTAPELPPPEGRASGVLARERLDGRLPVPGAHSRRLAGGSLALIALSVLPGPGGAQSPIELQATAGFQGHVTLGSWAPVRVVVRNRGPAATGELVIPPQDATEGHEHRLAVQVPQSSRRAFALYVRYRNPFDIKVQLRLTDGRRVTVSALCSPHEYGSRTVLVVSRKAGGLSFIGAVPVTPPADSDTTVKLDSVVTYASPDNETGALALPDHVAGYSSVSAVVLRDISPSSFEPEEQEALEGWVAGGGLLVILAGPNVAEIRDTFVEELAPVRIRGQRTLPHLEALARRFQAVVSLQRALVADTEPKVDAQSIAEQHGVPLLVRRPHENGTVYFCAVDCGAPPLESEDRLLLQLWGEILADGPFANLWVPVAALSSPDVQGLPSEVIRLPTVEWDSFAVFGGFLLVYIVVLFAVAQLLLKKTDRREWTGHVMLLVVGVFSLGALLLGRSVKLAFRRQHEAGVAHMRSGSSVAWIDGIVGMRSPNRHETTFRSSGIGRTLEYVCAGQRTSNWPIHQQPGFAARGVPIDLWGVAAFRVAGPLQMDGQIVAEFAEKSDQDLALIVENRTSCDLRYPFVLVAGTAYPVNDVPAGETEQVSSVPRGAIDDARPLPVSALSDVLVNHCHATDSPGASAEARIRRRVLQVLARTEPEGTPSMGSFGPMMYGQEEEAQTDLPLPSRPLFGAWVTVPSALAELSPPSDARASEVLLLVEIPVETSLLNPGNVAFGPLASSAGVRGSGMWTDWDNKLVVESGSHELTFFVPERAGDRRVIRLAVVLGCDQSGLSAEVWNVQAGAWERLEMDPGGTATTHLDPPGDYVLGSAGLVRVRLSRDQPLETRVRCTLSGELGPPRG